ncbi:MAG TPA: hypothetical protein ENK18_08335 [Deltaproteobacteria bacterium]|nr:hypothetical protein [Deltaproteobacteria bacterium]
MLLCVLVVLDAAAQDEGFDAHGFHFVAADADPRDPMTLLRPGDQGELDVSAGLLGEYASRPLVFEPQPGNRDVVLQDLVAANLAVGVSLMRLARIGVEFPMVLSRSGSAGSGALPGDLRISTMVAFAQPQTTGGLGLGLVARLGIPTGDPGAYLGEGGIFGGGGLVGTFEAGSLTASWELGGSLNPKTPIDQRPAPTRGGDQLEGGLGLGWLVDETVGIGIEAHGALALDDAVRTAIGIPAEALLTGRYVDPGGAFLTAGLGVGLGAGAGASPLRVLLGGGFSARSGPGPDGDGDGLVDQDDACPAEPETPNDYRDEDGCPDVLPEVVFVARVEGRDAPDAEVIVTGPDGSISSGQGQVRVRGRPGETFQATARLGACRRGEARVSVVEPGGASHTITILRITGQVLITVTDGVGRPLEGATVRYLTEDPACGSDNTEVIEGRGAHTLGVGEHTILVTAPGYDIHQQTLTIEPGGEISVKAILAPTQVRVEGSTLVLATPIRFAPGSSVLPPEAYTLLAQVATVIQVDGLSVQITGRPDSGSGRALAQARAQAASDQLRALGVSGERLSTATGGSSPAGHIQLRIVR